MAVSAARGQGRHEQLRRRGYQRRPSGRRRVHRGGRRHPLVREPRRRRREHIGTVDRRSTIYEFLAKPARGLELADPPVRAWYPVGRFPSFAVRTGPPYERCSWPRPSEVFVKLSVWNAGFWIVIVSAL